MTKDALIATTDHMATYIVSKLILNMISNIISCEIESVLYRCTVGILSLDRPSTLLLLLYVYV